MQLCKKTEEHQYVVYGDSAYLLVNYSHVRDRHNHSPKRLREILENKSRPHSDYRRAHDMLIWHSMGMKAIHHV